MADTQPTEQVPKPPSSEGSGAVVDLLKESVGYEQGLWRTLIDLRTKPKDVLEDYLAGDRKYVSPFKLLTTSLSLWIVINGFFVDWYTIWSQIFIKSVNLEASLIAWIGDFDAARRASFDQKLQEAMVPMLSIVGRIAGDLFSRWYVPFAILAVIGTSWLFTKRNPDAGISMKKIMSAFSYSVGSNIPFYLGMSIGFGINLYLGMGMVLVMAMLLLAGKAGKIMYASPGKFFEDQGKQIEKKLIRASFIVTFFLQGLLVIGYIIYFNW